MSPIALDEPCPETTTARRRSSASEHEPQHASARAHRAGGFPDSDDDAGVLRHLLPPEDRWMVAAYGE